MVDAKLMHLEGQLYLEARQRLSFQRVLVEENKKSITQDSQSPSSSHMNNAIDRLHNLNCQQKVYLSGLLSWTVTLHSSRRTSQSPVGSGFGLARRCPIHLAPALGATSIPVFRRAYALPTSTRCLESRYLLCTLPAGHLIVQCKASTPQHQLLQQRPWSFDFGARVQARPDKLYA